MQRKSGHRSLLKPETRGTPSITFQKWIVNCGSPLKWGVLEHIVILRKGDFSPIMDPDGHRRDFRLRGGDAGAKQKRRKASVIRSWSLLFIQGSKKNVSVSIKPVGKAQKQWVYWYKPKSFMGHREYVDKYILRRRNIVTIAFIAAACSTNLS